MGKDLKEVNQTKKREEKVTRKREPELCRYVVLIADYLRIHYTTVSKVIGRAGVTNK